MRIVARIVGWLLLLLPVLVAGAAAWLFLAPPDLIRVASAYSAKMVCSNVFVAGRDADEVLRIDVQAPGHPVLGYIVLDVDAEARTVTAGLLGLFGRETAVARDGLGCVSVPDGDVDAARAVRLEPGAKVVVPDEPWPAGNRVEPSQDPELAAVIDDPALQGPGLRAIVVVRDGRIVAERYGEGFAAETPLLGWSMTKTVTAAIIGTVIGEGKLSPGQKRLLPEWAGDSRAEIALVDLMGMSSGLVFDENYGEVTDVTRMLFLEPDMAAFAAGMPRAGGEGRPVFSYSSGTSVILSRIWQNAVGEGALAWPRIRLFDRIGMASAVLEADARGTFAGSSYLYATARDWARFGLLISRDGRWGDLDVLPPDYVEWMRKPAPASAGTYGQGQIWLQGPEGDTPPGVDPDASFRLPVDAVWLQGHDGQSMAVIPSMSLVVLRMGLTPSKLGYRPQPLVAAVIKALQ